MEGRPVWLASIATRNSRGEIIPTGELPKRLIRENEELLLRSLEGAGDSSREVLFRMNISLCLHRGLTDAEEAGLPSDFHAFAATDSAGSAVELLRVRGVTGVAHMPCENPRRRTPFRDHRLWLPEPCGVCAPCRARDAVRAAA